MHDRDIEFMVYHLTRVGVKFLFRWPSRLASVGALLERVGD